MHTIFLKYARAVKLDTAVESGLSTESEQYSVRTFLLDDTLHEVWLHGEEVYLVSHSLGCLHGGDVGIDKHGLDTFLAQCLQCL